MSVKTLYFKEHEGIVHNPIGQLSSVPSMPWWSNFGSQSAYGESMEQSIGGDKGNTNKFTIFPGDCKTSGEGQKSPQTVISPQTAPPEYHPHIDLGIGQPMMYAKYPHVDQCYGVFSTYGPQIPGRIMLPTNMTTDDGPIFVNPKQYHGIIRRRKTRAKAELLENKPVKKRQPYMHLSRHLHAMRRPRGTGGRFLNTKNSINEIGKTKAKRAGVVPLYPQTGSQNSEILQSDSGTLNSSEKTNGSGPNISGSEVTSMYSKRDLDPFSLNHYAPPLYSFSVIMDTGHSVVMPSKWVAAADNRCDLKV